jgi:hypothetical protein
MRTPSILAIAAALCLAVGASARTANVTCADGTTSKAGRGACSHHGGVVSAAPAPKAAAKRATVTCEDGTTSKPGRGACSHHGGIAGAGSSPEAATPHGTTAGRRPSSASSASSASGATARCEDGTYSHAAHHTGACSHHGHGGVAEWLDQR